MKKQILTISLLAFISLANVAKAQNDDFKPSGNLWGYLFGDYSYKQHADTLGRGGKNVEYAGMPQNSSGFAIRRAYLGYDYYFAPKFSAYVVLANESAAPESQSITPANNSSAAINATNFTTNPSNNTTPAGYSTTYLKYAYVKWSDIFKGSNLLFGQMTTPSFATPGGTEPLFGYRSIERTIMDMHNIDASTDLGVSLQGRLWDMTKGDTSMKPSFIGYQLQVGNGNSAKPESNIFKKFRGTVYVSTHGLTVGVYGDYQRTALSTTVSGSTYLTSDGVTTVTSYVAPSTSNMTIKAYAHYNVMNIVKIGVEYFNYNNNNYDQYYSSLMIVNQGKNKLEPIFANGAQTGLSVFLTGSIIKNKLSYFARMDMFNNDGNYNTSYDYSSTSAGLNSNFGSGASSFVSKATSTSNPGNTNSVIYAPAAYGVANPYNGATYSAATAAHDAALLNTQNYTNYLQSTFYKQTFYTLGIDYSPIPRFHIMPNVWINQYDASQISGAYNPYYTATNGVAQTITTAGKPKSDMDLVYRITCYFTFNGKNKVSNNGMND